MKPYKRRPLSNKTGSGLFYLHRGGELLKKVEEYGIIKITIGTVG